LIPAINHLRASLVLPTTVDVAVNGVTLTINQNGRVVRSACSLAEIDRLIELDYLHRDGQMLFVPSQVLADAYVLVPNDSRHELPPR